MEHCKSTGEPLPSATITATNESQPCTTADGGEIVSYDLRPSLTSGPAPPKFEWASIDAIRQEMGANERLRVYALDGRLLLDISVNDLIWPEFDEANVLDVADVMEFCKLDMAYTSLHVLGLHKPLQSDSELSWGHDYNAITAVCPR